MKLTTRTWIVFGMLMAAGFALWYRFTYPQFMTVDLSIGKERAVQSARDFLRARAVDPGRFITSATFDSDTWSDTYMQKTLGPEGEEPFVRANGFDIFYWKVRFFRQSEKEEYVFNVSPRTAEVIAYEHRIPDVEPRQSPDKDAAQAVAAAFLKERIPDFAKYEFYNGAPRRFENRVDQNFSWYKKGVSIPWKYGKGEARLLAGATISGGEVLAFDLSNLDLPESFSRYISQQMTFGRYFSSFSHLLFACLVIVSVVIFFNKRNTVRTRAVKTRFVLFGGFLVLVNFLNLFNEIQSVIIDYNTSTALGSYLGIFFIQSILGIVFTGFLFTVPALSGEALQTEAGRARADSLTHFSMSTFFCRRTASLILLGYMLFVFLLGMQSGIFQFGQQYCGVWKQWIKMTQFSSAYFPFLSAVGMGLSASMTEEGVFRVFGINWGMKYFKNTVMAVAFCALVWGFGHTEYAIFPIWFRGIEVTLIGLVYGIIFLRYGVIPLLVAHYLFDVFWGVAAYLLGKSTSYFFWASVAVMALPLCFALAAYLVNKPEEEREPRTFLDRFQKFNLGVLEAFVRERQGQGLADEAIRRELLANNWDPSLIGLALPQAGDKEIHA